MSSTYHPICLSHDPGIALDPELTRDEAKTLGSRDRFQGHEHCDVVIGRYSYPLIEVACLGRDFPGPTGCKSYHGGIQWTDHNWLRLLLAAAPSVDAGLLRPLLAACWPLERLERLRVELGLPDAAVATSTGAAGALREVLTAFRPVVGVDGRSAGYEAPHPIHPDDFARWMAALDGAQTATEGASA